MKLIYILIHPRSQRVGVFFFFSNMHLAEELIVPNKHTYYFINLFFCYKSNVKLHFFFIITTFSCMIIVNLNDKNNNL
jgi:hypothetical protein